MEGTTKARKIGTSLGVLIPAFAAEALGIKDKTLLTMIIGPDEITIKLKYPELKTTLDYINESLATIPVPDSEYY